MLSSLSSFGEGFITIKGQVWSITLEEYIVLSERRLVHIQRSAVPASEKKQFEVPIGLVDIGIRLWSLNGDHEASLGS